MRSVWASFQCKVRQNPTKARSGGPRPAEERHTEGTAPQHGHLYVQRPLKVRPPIPGSLSQIRHSYRRDKVLSRVAKILCFYFLSLVVLSLRQLELNHGTLLSLGDIALVDESSEDLSVGRAL